ncbi:MAG: AsnC family transcriptional regulator [Candidatus Hydrothermarchaeales archaeon]
MELDRTDKEILRRLQENLPIVKRPFLQISKEIGITEDEFFSRVRRLTDSGVIRKLGLRIDSSKVGFASTLIALKVPRDKEDKIGEQLNRYDFVTHNYARNHEYNVWFTIIERDKEALGKAVQKIRNEVPFEDMLDLPITKRFKIDVRFEIR